MIDFPPREDAPYRLHELDSNCGLLVAWGVLRYFHKRSSSAHLIPACRHTKKHGVFAIALAVVLKEYGLSVTFYSDPDPAPKRIERRFYHRAAELGIPAESGIELDEVLSLLTSQTVPIVLYKTDDGSGHFSPIVGYADGYVDLLYAETDENQRMPTEELYRRWTAPEIYRQCVIVSR